MTGPVILARAQAPLYPILTPTKTPDEIVRELEIIISKNEGAVEVRNYVSRLTCQDLKLLIHNPNQFFIALAFIPENTHIELMQQLISESWISLIFLIKDDLESNDKDKQFHINLLLRNFSKEHLHSLYQEIQSRFPSNLLYLFLTLIEDAEVAKTLVNISNAAKNVADAIHLINGITSQLSDRSSSCVFLEVFLNLKPIQLTNEPIWEELFVTNIDQLLPSAVSHALWAAQPCLRHMIIDAHASNKEKIALWLNHVIHLEWNFNRRLKLIHDILNRLNNEQFISILEFMMTHYLSCLPYLIAALSHSCFDFLFINRKNGLRSHVRWKIFENALPKNQAEIPDLIYTNPHAGRFLNEVSLRSKKQFPTLADLKKQTSPYVEESYVHALQSIPPFFLALGMKDDSFKEWIMENHALWISPQLLAICSMFTEEDYITFAKTTTPLPHKETQLNKIPQEFLLCYAQAKTEFMKTELDQIKNTDYPHYISKLEKYQKPIYSWLEHLLHLECIHLNNLPIFLAYQKQLHRSKILLQLQRA